MLFWGFLSGLFEVVNSKNNEDNNFNSCEYEEIKKGNYEPDNLEEDDYYYEDDE